MRAGKKAIGGPHAPAGRTHAVQCVGGDYVRMYNVPACVSLAMCVTATVTMAARAACSYICRCRRLRKSEGANRRSATQTQRLTGAAAGVHTCTYKYKHRGYCRHRQNRKRRAEKGAGVLTSRYFAPEAGTRHRSRPSPQFNSIQLGYCTRTTCQSRLRVTPHASPMGRHQPKTKKRRDPRRSIIRGARRVRVRGCERAVRS